MKVTKVGGLRLAIVNKEKEDSRVVCYTASPGSNANYDIYDVVKKRALKANKAYNIFYRGRNPELHKLPNSLEERVSWLLSSMEYRNEKMIQDAYKSGAKEIIEECINKQIIWLKECTNIEQLEWDNQKKDYMVKKCVGFPEAKVSDLTDEALDKAIFRMRRALKNGSNGMIVKEIIKALAQGKRTDYSELLCELESKEEAAFKKFIDHVNKDFYHFNAAKAIENTEVAVRPEGGKIELSSHNKSRKNGIQATVLQYAESEKKSDEVLLEMRKVLLSFFAQGTGSNDIYNKNWNDSAEENLWSFQGLCSHYFDYGFISKEGATEDNVESLEEMFKRKDSEINRKKLAARIQYINFGKYVMLSKTYTENNCIQRYWCDFIKKYIEQNYVTRIFKVKREEFSIKRDVYKIEVMMSKCWHEMIRHLCGKYINLGKAVYHFVLPEHMELKSINLGKIESVYEEDITSFDYENIKAEENLQKAKFEVLVAAVANFSRSVADYEGKKGKNLNEDVLMLKEEEFSKIKYDDAKQRVLRYFGGYSACDDAVKECEIVEEFRQTLKVLRNGSFHYSVGKESEMKFDAIKKLWKQDIKANKQMILHKYNANNVCRFYRLEEVKSVIEMLYCGTNEEKEKKGKKVNEAYIPSFRSVWKRSDFTEDVVIKKTIQSIGESEKEQEIFANSLYFLFKEIYYQKFIMDAKAVSFFYSAAKEHCNRAKKQKKTYRNSSGKLWGYIDKLREEKMQEEKRDVTLGEVCQRIMAECNQQNNKDNRFYQNLKKLWLVCMQEAFSCYVNNYYRMLFEPEFQGGDNKILDAEIDNFIELKEDEISAEEYSWYLLAHFIHPRKLNHFEGALKNYLQFKQDIIRRGKYAGVELKHIQEHMDVRKDRINRILQVLEFVRSVSGCVTNVISDYYSGKNSEEIKNAYAGFLNKYMDFSINYDENAYEEFWRFYAENMPENKPIGMVGSMYAPRIIKNVEFTRMYAGGDVALKKRSPVKASEIKEYYEMETEVISILRKGIAANKEEQEKVINQQRRKNRITLYDVTLLQEIINDLLSQLVTFSYFRERDQMYLLLGFYYTALKSNAGANWNEEIMDAYNGTYITAEHGAVLHQVVSIFTYGMPVCYFKNGKETYDDDLLSRKLGRFSKVHKASLKKALRLFFEEDTQHEKMCVEIRNYVDHFKFYTNRDKSIMELYSLFYEYFFEYSTKMRKSVLAMFKSILEEYYVKADLDYIHSEKRCTVRLGESLRSEMFTYKVEAPLDEKVNRKQLSRVELPARDDEFLNNLKEELEYRVIGNRAENT